MVLAGGNLYDLGSRKSNLTRKLSVMLKYRFNACEMIKFSGGRIRALGTRLGVFMKFRAKSSEQEGKPEY